MIEIVEPIRLSFEVECPVEHAFEVWTGRIAQWWPRDHTVSGDADLTVVLEARPGGRIFERRANGIEHDWGSRHRLGASEAPRLHVALQPRS